MKTGKVGARGNPLAPLVIVGESPGKKELYNGIPFIGMSGDILWDSIPEDEIAIDEETFTTNAAQCWPGPKKNMQITSACTHACRDRLLSEIGVAPRKLIIALGNAALWSLTGDFSLKITQERGRLIQSPLAEIGILPIIHPAALIHGTGTHEQFQDDIRYALDLYEGAKPKAPTEPKFFVCNTPKKVERALKVLWGRKGELSVDTETSSLNHRDGYIIATGICYKPELVFIFPGDVTHKLRELFKSKKHTFIWHNGKFDIQFFRDRKAKARVDEDTMLLSYTLNEKPGYHDLELLSSTLLGAQDYKHYVKPYAPKKSDSFANVPRDILYRYRLAPDTSYTMQIFRKLRPRVAKDAKLDKLYTKILIPGSDLLYHVERVGFAIDMEWVNRVHIRLKAETEQLEAEFQEIAGHPINPRSPSQIAALLYDELKLQPLKGHKRSTAKFVIERLPQVPAVVALRAYRTKHKELSTNITGKRNGIFHVLQDDGRVHTTFLLHGSKTGRLASRAPNTQNPPRIKIAKDGKIISDVRGMYTAPQGQRLLEVDLNQAELRSLACLSGDDFLCEIYRSTDRSLHNEVSIELFGPNYTHEEKMRAKAVNFGIVYGREAPSIADEFGIPIPEAQSYIEKWFFRMPKAHACIMSCRNAVKLRQTLVTCFGRKKRHSLVPEELGLLKAMQNEAANFPHQSIASDITLYTAIVVAPILRKMKCFIVNLVHDSIVIQCPDNDDIVRRAKAIVEFTMENVPLMWGLTKVPFKAESKEGYRWGYLKEKPDEQPREKYPEVLEAQSVLQASM